MSPYSSSPDAAPGEHADVTRPGRDAEAKAGAQGHAAPDAAPNAPVPIPVPTPTPTPGPAAPAPWCLTAHYTPRRSFWESRAGATGALFTALAVCGWSSWRWCGGTFRDRAVRGRAGAGDVPVPLMMWVFLSPLDQVAPSPWQNVAFAFSWGACAATLVALFANEYGAKLLATTFSGTPTQTDQWGAAFVAPLVRRPRRAPRSCCCSCTGAAT